MAKEMRDTTASLHFFFLLTCTAAIISPSFSRSLGPSLPSSPGSTPGPIETNGKNYSKVCDPARFAAMGLNMDGFHYCNISLPYEMRVKDLIGRMTLAEKVAQLGDKAEGVERIALPKYNWWSEALHGIASGFGSYFGDIVPGATSFPTPVLTAASFNESLWKTIAKAISTEGRAMYNVGHAGLTFWSPNINIVRDPRWGRALETPGEDPFMVGRYAVNFIRGLQDIEQFNVLGDLKSRPLKVSGCCKHFAAYDLDKWFQADRHKFDARVTEQDMIETFMRPFEVCVKEGDVSSVMCSFNKINGIPACADTNLMTTTFRDEYQLNGYIVSDCDSLDVIYRVMNWLGDTQEDAIGQTLKAGLDLNCGWGQYNIYQHWGESAVYQGKVRETDIDRALTNLYVVLMRAGYFDNIPALENLGVKDICSEEHIELATEAARQGTVLLKNCNNTLPLDPTKINLAALVGPHANATTPMIGNYNGIPCRYTSPLEAIGKDVKVEYNVGCDVLCTNESMFSAAVDSAKNADVTVIFAGLSLDVEAEERDRMDLFLPGNQTDLINQVAAASKGPVVLVIFSGGGVDISFAENNPKIVAIIWAGYPGEEGGQAIADIIFGRYNPAGRLPLTWYTNDYVKALPMTSMKLRPVGELGYPGRTYKFFNGTALYPFGHGLSYTAFNYTLCNPTTSLSINVSNPLSCKLLTYNTNLTAPPCASVNTAGEPCMDAINFVVEVKNTGSTDGNHTVLVYSRPPPEVADAPMKQLVGYLKAFVPANQSANLTFTINACKALALVDRTAYVVLPAGNHTIEVGDGPALVSFPLDVTLQV